MAALGVLAENEQLPSVRSVAQELGVNVNTVQKAYQMLERDGVIVSYAGKGSFLASGEQGAAPAAGHRKDLPAGGSPAGFGVRRAGRGDSGLCPGRGKIGPGRPGERWRERMIAVQQLVKRFGEKAALDGISLQVETGSVFGLVGSNGAGKSHPAADPGRGLPARRRADSGGRGLPL